jgi:hypothetical protein
MLTEQVCLADDVIKAAWTETCCERAAALELGARRRIE